MRAIGFVRMRCAGFRCIAGHLRRALPATSHRPLTDAFLQLLPAHLESLTIFFASQQRAELPTGWLTSKPPLKTFCLSMKRFFCSSDLKAAWQHAGKDSSQLKWEHALPRCSY
uniref:Uncharacterized protein n=1 Tax=Pyrodinium bahamense TaxID=73915 RepID=A0A7S0FXY5_9DINO